MNELATQFPVQRLGGTLPVPLPRRDVSIRVATMDDLPFLDAMQKKHGKALGYFPTKQFEGYIAMGGVLIAHDGAERLGYVISRDRYLKRDELGVVYQLCVAAGEQRKLVGASLVRGVFDRSAYGCKLYCCWCAQDLPANHFWESMGFLPIAFRAGSAGKRRVHIFWQRRINEGDDATPYWYPCQTNSGAIREDRLVFPIPPGTHWSEVRPIALPQSPVPVLDAPLRRKPRAPIVKDRTPCLLSETRGLHFAPSPAPAKPAAERAAKPKVKIDPALVAKARELRDRYLERVNGSLVLTSLKCKYLVSRSPGARGEEQVTPLLKAG